MIEYVVAGAGTAVGSLGVLVAWFTYRRAGRSSKISDALNIAELWEKERDALVRRVESLEQTNKVQASQISDLQDRNSRLQELVTSAAAVTKLIELTEEHHRVVMEHLIGGKTDA